VEEFHAERLLERSDGMAYRGWRDVKFFRRGLETHVSRGDREGANCIERR
jgi:hypothetical protein